MNKKEIAYTPVYKLIELIESQKITSEEITEILIERIKDLNPKLNAYCTPTFDLARKMAINADKRVKKGQKTGILNDIPVSIKDLNAVAGVRMTMGLK